MSLRHTRVVGHGNGQHRQARPDGCEVFFRDRTSVGSPVVDRCAQGIVEQPIRLGESLLSLVAEREIQLGSPAGIEPLALLEERAGLVEFAGLRERAAFVEERLRDRLVGLARLGMRVARYRRRRSTRSRSLARPIGQCRSERPSRWKGFGFADAFAEGSAVGRSIACPVARLVVVIAVVVVGALGVAVVIAVVIAVVVVVEVAVVIAVAVVVGVAVVIAVVVVVEVAVGVIPSDALTGFVGPVPADLVITTVAAVAVTSSAAPMAIHFIGPVLLFSNVAPEVAESVDAVAGSAAGLGWENAGPEFGADEGAGVSPPPDPDDLASAGPGGSERALPAILATLRAEARPSSVAKGSSASASAAMSGQRLSRGFSRHDSSTLVNA